jgi:hypothetical protein
LQIFFSGNGACAAPLPPEAVAPRWESDETIWFVVACWLVAGAAAVNRTTHGNRTSSRMVISLFFWVRRSYICSAEQGHPPVVHRQTPNNCSSKRFRRTAFVDKPQMNGRLRPESSR